MTSSSQESLHSVELGFPNTQEGMSRDGLPDSLNVLRLRLSCGVSRFI